MKKLIAMIGAVATAFGLYATDLTKSAVSFEAAEPGCSGDTLDLEKDTLWSTDYDDVFKFGATTEETTYAGAYTGTTRRTDEFTGSDENLKFLKLSTGTTSLQRLFTAKVEDEEVDVSTDPIFIDQLVKFTGFEDTQTVFAAGTKVAVWMSEFVTNETADVEQTLTNLYVAVGKVVGGNVTLKNVKIDGDYQLDKWYRLTIRSIGNIVEDTSASPNALSGFAIYINGNPLTIVSEDQNLLDISSALIPKAKVLYDKGQLFPSMVAGSTTLKSVGFQGMGAIDDMIVDAVGPAFAQEANFKIPELEGIDVLCVSNIDENIELVADANGYYTAIPGQAIRIYFTAQDKYVLTPDPKPYNFNAEAGTLTLEITDVEAEEALMAVDGVYYAESNLDDAFEVLAEGEHEAEFYDEVEYSFEVEAENYTYVFGAAAKLVSAVDEETGAVSWEIEGDFGTDFSIAAGNEIAIEGKMTLKGDITVAGTLSFATLEQKPEEDTYRITLVGEGQVMAPEQLTIEEVFGNLDPTKIAENFNEDDCLWVYTLKAGVEFTITDNTANTATYKVFVDDEDVTDNVPATLNADQTYKVVATAKDGYAYEVAGKSSKTFEITGTADTEPITVTVPAATAAKAKKGGIFFLTLQEAIDAEGTDAIKILDDIALDARIEISGKTVDIEADDELTISCASAGVFKLINGSDVTIGENVTLTSTANPTVFVIGSNLTIDGVVQNTNPTYDKAFAVCGSGNDTEVGCNIVVNGKVENAMDAGIYFPCAGTLVVNGEVMGYTAIIIKNGALTVKPGAVITATGTDFKRFPKNTNGAQSTGDAIVAGYYGAIDAYGTPKVSILGGTITVADAVKDQAVGVQGYDSDERKAPDDAKSNIAVQGGTFNAPVLEGYCASGYIPKKNDDGTYGVKQGKYVARVNGQQGYETLAEAVTAAVANDTVTLLTNVTLEEEIEVAKAITIDLAKNTVTVEGEAEGAFWFVPGSDGFVLSNGTIAANFAEFNADAYLVQFCIENKDTILNGTVKDLTVNAENCAGGVVGVTDSWDLDPAVNTLITCENVAVTGGRYLFYFENPNARLVNCTATQANGLDSQVWRNCAVGAGWGSTVTVESGTYTAEDYVLCTMSSPEKLVVLGGTFTGKVMDYEPTYPGEHVWEISGGDFSDREIPDTFIKPVDGMIAYWADSETYENYVTPAWKVPTYVAMIGDKGYETFEAAVLALKDMEGATLTLLDNVTAQIGNQIGGTDVTIDLGGFTLTAAEGGTALAFVPGSSVTLTNGVIDLKKTGNGYGIKVEGDLVVECTINSYDYCSVFDIYPAAGTITVGDQAVLTSTTDIFRYKDSNNQATLTINGGVMTGGNGNGIIAVYKPNNTPTININGGTFLTEQGGSCGIVKAKTETTAVPTVNITGGEFATTANFITEDGATITLTLGADAAAAKFATDTNLKAYCDTGYFAKEVGDWYQIALAKTVTSLTLNETAVEMAPEATTNLTATIYPIDADIASTEWTSSAEGVATVSAEGVVTAVADGSATITYTVVDVLDNETKVSCAITVKTPSSDPIPPLPVNPTADDVNNAIDKAKFVDPAVKTLIGGDATKYNAFKAWANTVSGGEAAVVASQKAAKSYEMSSVAEAHLFTNEPEIKITATEAGTSWTATVAIKDGETPVAAIKAIEDQVQVTTTVENKDSWIKASATAVINDGIATITITKPGDTKGFMRVNAAK